MAGIIDIQHLGLRRFLVLGCLRRESLRNSGGIFFRKKTGKTWKKRIGDFASCTRGKTLQLNGEGDVVLSVN